MAERQKENGDLVRQFSRVYAVEEIKKWDRIRTGKGIHDPSIKKS